MSRRQAKITGAAVSIIFFFWPSAVAWLICRLLREIIIFPDWSKVVPILISALIGYAFTATFFLVALPRTGYLEKLDRKDLTRKYAYAISIPAITGILHLIASFLSTHKKGTSAIAADAEMFAAYLFFFSIAQFFWSLFIVFRIVGLSRQNI